MNQASSPLEALAHRYGVTTSYPDIDGRWHQAEPEALLAIVKSLGARIEGLDDVAEALRVKQLEEWRTPIEPVCVAWDNESPRLELRLESPSFPLTVKIQIEVENGPALALEQRLESGHVSGHETVEGIHFVAANLDLAPLPFGRHRATVELLDRRFTVWIFQAPRRAWPAKAKAWGIFAPTYSLHSKASIGTGDFGDLSRLLCWTEQHGGSFVGTLPILPSFLAEPFDPSPYAPISRLFWNEFYLDLPQLLRDQPCPAAAALLDTGKRLLQSDPTERLIDYRSLARLKRSVLDELSRSFMASNNAERASFDAFIAQKPEAIRYAQFRAAQENNRGNWRTWPVTLDGSATLDGHYQPEVFDTHLYAQWRAHQQLQALTRNGAGAGLYLDLPVGAHPDGYDAWRYRSSFLPDVCAGAPPDAFFSKGQNWGFAPLSPERIREDGYAYVRACFEHHLSVSQLLRIDHVMGLHRLFCVPTGMAASSGVYVRYRHDELYALLTLASVRHHAPIIGEDLGTVPTEVREQMDHHGLLRMYVAQFSMSEHEPTIAPPSAAVLATLNTHDTAPFAAFAEGLDIRDRMALGLLSPEQTEIEIQARLRLVAAVRRKLGVNSESNAELLEKLIAFLIESPAQYLLLGLEDAWLEPMPQNVPGTQFERPNWQRKMAHSLEELDDIPELRRLLSRLRERSA